MLYNKPRGTGAPPSRRRTPAPGQCDERGWRGGAHPEAGAKAWADGDGHRDQRRRGAPRPGRGQAPGGGGRRTVGFVSRCGHCI